jgi:signal transduction histidine kinase
VGEENRNAAEASLGSTDSTRSGGSALPPERPGVTLYRAGRGQTPKVAVVFSSATVIAERYHPVLSVEANALVGLLQSEVARPVSARLLNWAGNELVTADLESGGIAAMHAHWDAAGFADHEDAPPYLGVMNLHLGRSSEPRIRSSQDGIHSLIPIPDIGASIVLRDQPARQGLFFGGPAVPIVLLGLALYVLIVVLFVRYRRTVLGQTRRLNQFSEQKNLLFSLLSHNLKNNLAAVAAEAQATPGNQRVLAPVADASRTISNSLYYLQFQEGTFEPPPLEPVQIGELLEFLSLRCVAEAEAKSQALQCGTEPVEEVWIWTNLSMALEALERLLVNAIQYSPTFSDISLDVTVDAHSASIVMTDAGPGLPTTARAVYEHALDSPMLESSMTASPLSSRSLRGIGAYVARGILERLGARVHLLQTGPEGTRLAAEFPRTPSPSLTGI